MMVAIDSGDLSEQQQKRNIVKSPEIEKVTAI